MEHEYDIAKHIIARKGTLTQFSVAICGAADIGKSYLSRKLAVILNNQGIGTSHLPIDAFLLDRSERLRIGMSGYDAQAYDFDAIQKLLSQLKFRS